ncbi:bifunctional anthranilate synthase component I family protein/class IV aminotransferase [Lentisphaerota bacterium WC36G]|nr:bifunctional anthranilate synthase component I family protein/aminotransferase class IV [Lentisphaerae bacterium WC36]
MPLSFTMFEEFDNKQFIICRLINGNWGLFTNPNKILSLTFSELKNDTTRLKNIFNKINNELKSGNYVAGYIHYEAAIGFDKSLKVNEKQIKNNELIVCFGVFDKAPQKFNFISQKKLCLSISENNILTSKKDYTKNINKLKEYIFNGDIYQANYTVRTLLKTNEPSLFKIFNYINCGHPVPYSSFVKLTNGIEIASISPELFFKKTGRKISSLPMKGTMSRHYDYNIDKTFPEILGKDIKNRAENVMICDMVRNDIGKIAKPNSVKVDKLFHVDTYQTLHQMISEVSGEIIKSKNTPYEIFQALFPAASITGAPKVRAMEIIKELEDSPRGVYTGTIGYFSPTDEAVFNVPIRTLIKRSNSIEINLSVGSGVVADSLANDEWNELKNKTEFITKNIPENFSIFSTMLFNNKFYNNFKFYNEHINRLANSQKYFARPFYYEKVNEALQNFAKKHCDSSDYFRLKIKLFKDGEVALESTNLGKIIPKFKNHNSPIKLKLYPRAIDSQNIFLHHKTSMRKFYDIEYSQTVSEGFHEVIFFNENNYITEGTISNIFIQKNNQWYTPHRDCGLLNGIMREKLIKKLQAQQSLLTIKDLQNSSEIIICNSLRGIARHCQIH